MAVQLHKKTAADAVTEMLAHAVTEEGLDQLYQLKREAYIFYDYRDRVFTETPLLGRTMYFGWLKTKTKRDDGFRGYIRSQVRKIGPHLYEIQDKWKKPYDEYRVCIQYIGADPQHAAGWVHHSAISHEEWLAIAHDWLITGQQSDRDPALEAEVYWEELCAEVTGRLLTLGETDGKAACDLTERSFFLRRAVNPNSDQVIAVVKKAINHQLATDEKADLSHIISRMDMWLTECSPALTHSQRLQLVKAVDHAVTRMHKPLKVLGRALDMMRSLGADVTARVNLCHFNGVVLEPREDIVLHSIIPTGPDFYGQFHHGLSLPLYLDLRDALVNPIEVSQLSLAPLQMQATLSDEPVQLDLDHFKLVPVHVDDRDWIERTSKPIHFEWTMKTQA